MYLFCFVCTRLLRDPVTCICGMTMCNKCSPTKLCKCGRTVPYKVNTALKQIIEKLLTQPVTFDKTSESQYQKEISANNTSEPLKNTAVSKYKLKTVTSLQIDEICESDFDCSICLTPYLGPIATPCGHMFCKLCIERSLYYTENRCPMCMKHLTDFNISQVNETALMADLLRCMQIYGYFNRREYYVPLIHVNCEYFPEVLYLVFPPSSWKLVEYNMRYSGCSIGIVLNCDITQGLGYVANIKDCVLNQDGHLLLTAQLETRIMIKSRYIVHGFHKIGLVENFYDFPIRGNDVNRVIALSRNVVHNLIHWLLTLDANKLRRIRTLYGKKSIYRIDILDDIHNMNGSMWLWKVIRILPINNEKTVSLFRMRNMKQRLARVNKILKAALLQSFVNDFIRSKAMKCRRMADIYGSMP